MTGLIRLCHNHNLTLSADRHLARITLTLTLIILTMSGGQMSDGHDVWRSPSDARMERVLTATGLRSS